MTFNVQLFFLDTQWLAQIPDATATGLGATIEEAMAKLSLAVSLNYPDLPIRLVIG